MLNVEIKHGTDQVDAWLKTLFYSLHSVNYTRKLLFSCSLLSYSSSLSYRAINTYGNLIHLISTALSNVPNINGTYPRIVSLQTSLLLKQQVLDNVEGFDLEKKSR